MENRAVSKHSFPVKYIVSTFPLLPVLDDRCLQKLKVNSVTVPTLKESGMVKTVKAEEMSGAI